VRRDLGDFQTPSELVAAVLGALEPLGERWTRVLEPTCGEGRFIDGLLALPTPPREIQAIEIQEDHCRAARESALLQQKRGVRVHITHGDLFDLDLKRDLAWRERGPLLVIGNPPWVTSAELGALVSPSQPPRHNLKGLRGLEARTGSSNFDVAEAVWLKLISELAGEAPVVALLCKTSVARSVLQSAYRMELPIAAASLRRIDAGRWFAAAVDACLFCVTLGRADPDWRLPVYAGLCQDEPDSVMGFAHGWLVADRDAYARTAFAEGACPLTWRQGLKHDAAAVMELVGEPASGRWRNRAGEVVEVEPRFVYPLAKGRDLREKGDASPQRGVLVTQHRLGTDTAQLAHTAPRLWRYLQAHAAYFKKRKSSIYRGRPPFALFGVGPYSFAPFKVAVAGLHKEPRFRALGPVRGRPVMVDDTCYFLPCASAAGAAILVALCNDPITLEFIRSARFRDAKRPITKKLLQRIDLPAILKRADRRALLERAESVLGAELCGRRTETIAEVMDRVEAELAAGPTAEFWEAV
jgi:hypothetical protein